MNVTIFDPYFNDNEFLQKYDVKRCFSYEELFSMSDVISLHVPATMETKGIINQRTIDLMKPSTLIINTSRGELVNEEDLYMALLNKRIAGAAQDVFSSEPPGKDEKLLKLDNFILTPHIGAFTHEAVEKMVMVSTQNLLNIWNNLRLEVSMDNINTKSIITVKGYISSSELGFCHSHEHLFLAEGQSSKIHAALRLDDYSKTLEEVISFKNAGGKALVDAQPVGCGRMADKLVLVSEQSDINIIASKYFMNVKESLTK